MTHLRLMSALRVIEIFDSLQGEGMWTGFPMTFVRLAGCNAFERSLTCAQWCDTSKSWDPNAGEELEVEEVLKRTHLPRLCLTGGEPLLQLDRLDSLVQLARWHQVRVHLETNGTVDPGSVAFDWAVVSPKPPMFAVAPGWTGHVDELKLIVDESLDVATAERLAASYPRATISVQPRHEGGPQGLPESKIILRAIEMVMSHPQWRLSLQTHRLLGIS